MDAGDYRSPPGCGGGAFATLGFRPTGETQVWSNPRNEPITPLRVALEAPA
jgi:hypothetical protein